MAGTLLLGPARCGSTLISRMLADHPAVLSLSECFAMIGPRAFRPDFCDGPAFWRALSEPLPGMSRIGNPDTAPDEFLYHLAARRAHDPWRCPPLLAITLPHLSDDPDALFDALRPVIMARGYGPLAGHYLALFGELARGRGPAPGVWAERSGGSLAAAGVLTRMFPQARRIVLLRAGADTALSLRDYIPGRLAIWLWRNGMGLIDPISVRGHLGRGAVWPLMARVGGVLPLGPVLRRRPSLRDCGRFWSALMCRGEAALAGGPVLTLRYEDLLADPRAGARRLGMAVADAAPASWLARAAALPRARAARLAGLDRADRDILLEACAPGEGAAARLHARGGEGVGG
ncbi:MAG: sulfotransferase [Paracoccus sp. (in: a-proteobacteria)]|nr:sulfotransferase [Paracoccus sp. (in: a-proteobacteria)]